MELAIPGSGPGPGVHVAPACCTVRPAELLGHCCPCVCITRLGSAGFFRPRHVRAAVHHGILCRPMRPARMVRPLQLARLFKSPRRAWESRALLPLLHLSSQFTR